MWRLFCDIWKPTRRRRSSQRRAEVLESRQLLAAAVGTPRATQVPSFQIGPKQTVYAGAGLIQVSPFITNIQAELSTVRQPLGLGNVQFQSYALAIDDIRGAAGNDDMIVVVGNEGAYGVRQIVNPTTGTVSDFERFRSSRDLTNGSDIDRGFINGVTLLDDGRFLYYGFADQVNYGDPSIPTVWYGVEEPHVVSSPLSATDYFGFVFSANAHGVITGNFSTIGTVEGVPFLDRGAVGTVAGQLHRIPSGFAAVFGVSDDNRYLVGDDNSGTGLWRELQPGSLDYERMSNSHWDALDDAAQFPHSFSEIVQTSNGYFIPAEYVVENTFESRVALYNVETGDLLGKTLTADYLAGAGRFQDEVVLAVNGVNGGAFYVLGPQGLGPRIELSSILGEPATFAGGGAFTTLFDNNGSLGFVANVGIGSIVSSHVFSVELTGGTLSLQQIHFEVSVDHPEWFSTQPTISTSGELTYAPKSRVQGTATVRVRLVDDGHGGLSSAWKQFSIEIRPTVALVPSRVHQGNLPANVVSMSVASFEVALKGSATLDVTKLDKTSLFIGDVRNSTSGKVTSIRFTDTNKDGFKDAILTVQSKTALRANTTRLKITGRTTAGNPFDGSLNVTSTQLTWSTYWQSTFGNQWRSLFNTYSKGLKKTWW